VGADAEKLRWWHTDDGDRLKVITFRTKCVHAIVADDLAA
jgi:hypothetical protein